MRGPTAPSPAQYETPRREGPLPDTATLQSSVPRSGSRATTRPAAGKYMTPFTTIGVACEFTADVAGEFAAPPAPRCPGPESDAPPPASRYVQALVSVATFATVTSANGEYASAGKVVAIQRPVTLRRLGPRPLGAGHQRDTRGDGCGGDNRGAHGRCYTPRPHIQQRERQFSLDPSPISSPDWRPNTMWPTVVLPCRCSSRFACAGRCSSKARRALARPRSPPRLPRRSEADLIRLQCYEGLDVTHAVYEWDYARQLLELRILEAAGDVDRARRTTRAVQRKLS